MDVGVDVCRLWALSVDSSRVTDPRSASRASTSRVVSERASHATRVVTPSRRLSPSRARDQPRDGDHRVDVESDAEPLFARAFTAASPLARRDDADRWRTRNPSERTALLAPSALARALDRRIDAILEDRIDEDEWRSSARGVDVGFSRAVRDRTRVRWWFYCRNRSNRAIDVDGGCERWRDW